jgi:hypothetical protein
MATLGLDEPAWLVQTLVALLHATLAIAVSFTRNVILVARAPATVWKVSCTRSGRTRWSGT